MSARFSRARVFSLGVELELQDEGADARRDGRASHATSFQSRTLPLFSLTSSRIGNLISPVGAQTTLIMMLLY